MHAAAQSHLTEISPEQRKNYISKETWNLIKERQAQRQMGDAEKENELTKQIKKSADDDKEKYCIKRLEGGISLREKWQEIKIHKRQVTPNFNKAKYVRGSRIAKGDRAEATAE